MPDIPDDLMRELLQTFRIEASEHLQTLNQAFLKIERLPDDADRRELVQNAFRAAHSLKGAARAVDFRGIETLAHSIENVLQQASDSDTALEPNVCDVLYMMLDGIQHSLEGEEIDVASLEARLSALVGNASSTSNGSAVSNTKIERETDKGAPLLSIDETIRIPVSKLDELMAETGELLISKMNADRRIADIQLIRQQLARWPRGWREITALLPQTNAESRQQLQELLLQHHTYLQDLTRSLEQFEQTLNSDILHLGMVTTDIQEDVRRARMLPVQTVSLGLERVVRDAAHMEGKLVAFSIEGRDIEVDKRILETLKDPLVHLLRNAVSHGIEPSEEREAAGKPREGQVWLVVRQRGSEVSFTVKDDGRGFDLERLSQVGNSVLSDAHDRKSSEVLISLAFLPGVTTSHQITAISGRGVGLDVVRQRMEDIHGRITVNSTSGKGAAIELIVPSSLTMTRGLVVRINNEQFVLPLLSVERIVEVGDTFSIGGKQILRLEQMSVPLVALAAILERPMTSNGKPSTPLAVIIKVAEQRLALLVDEVLIELELVVKPLGYPLRRVPNVAGAAVMGDGRPIVILNPGDLIRSARSSPIPELNLNRNVGNEPLATNHILVVDDSITTRTLEKNILEAAGYQVTTAIDGVEALKRLKEQVIDLVVTDVQMPNMDGIVLTRQIRETADYKHLPIILVTSLESPEDREKGMIAGADAYIVKRGFSQSNLLTIIRQFLETVV